MNEEAEFLAKENKDLRERLAKLTAPKAQICGTIDDGFETKEDHLLDEIDRLKKLVNHLEAALGGIEMTIRPGDVIFVNRQKLLNSDSAMWMSIAKKYGCTFVSLPFFEEGIDIIQKKTPLELQAYGLRHINESDLKHTKGELLDAIMSQLKNELNRYRSLEQTPENADRVKRFVKATHSLFDAMKDITHAEDTYPTSG